MTFFARKSVLLVLGMHRSGTSALTRVLSLCGGALPRTLFEAVAGDNERGYWESRRLIEYHEALLSRIGTTMIAEQPIDPAWFASKDARVAEADLLKIVHEEWGRGMFSQSRCWLIKEPRICRLLPLWRRVLRKTGRRVSALHAVREPAEVAASLAKRDGMPTALAQRAWMEHVLLAERYTRDLPRAFVSYQLLMGDWRTVVARAAAILPRGTLAPTPATAAIEEFLHPSLRHHAAIDEPLSDSVTRVRDAMMDAVRWGAAPRCEILDDVCRDELAAVHESEQSNAMARVTSVSP